MGDKRGMFIVFEGIDGSGKTTQIKKFVHYLYDRDKHNHIIFTRNPYKDSNIRAILRDGDDPLTQAEKLADLFIEDRKKQAEELILPAITQGNFVVSDRFKLSTISYQSAQGLDMQTLIDKHEGLPIPDMTFIVDTPAQLAGVRMKQESSRNEHKFEKNLDFLEQVRLNHHKAKALLGGERIFVLDGTRSVDEIFNEVKWIFERFTAFP